MNYITTLIAVKNMEKSKKFYRDVLGLNVVTDLGSNVTLDGGLVLQTLDSWKSFIRTDEVILPNNAVELYFEEEDFDEFLKHLKSFDIEYVHEVFEHRWGQRVVRFYDLDNHIIEVGEKIDSVVCRFIKNGLSVEETAKRMDVPLDFVLSALNNN